MLTPFRFRSVPALQLAQPLPVPVDAARVDDHLAFESGYRQMMRANNLKADFLGGQKAMKAELKAKVQFCTALE